MKRLTILLLFAASPFVLNLQSTETKTNDNLSDYEVAMFALKMNEGLRLKSYWDYKQYSVGWGTKGTKGEKITYNEANKRARAEYERRYRKVRKKYPNLSRFQALILTNFSYNVKIGKNLNKALKEGRIEDAQKIMLLYVNAGGERKEGLVNRRNLEAFLLTATPSQKQAIGEAAKQIVKNHIKKAHGK